MSSAIYQLFARAILARKQIVCSYSGYPREVCPIILGRTKGAEKALVYQFAGETSKGPIRGKGDWKCFELAKIRDPELREGPWHAGSSHQQRQTCVEDVEFDVNPDSPYT